MNKFSLSIIIPFYNVEKYIYDCLRCLLTESSRIFEIILVNDGSTDNSEVIVEKFMNDNSENLVFIYIKQNNMGLSAARNAGLNVARGNYISFIDSDDVFNLNVMFDMACEADNSNADIVVADYYEFSDSFKKNNYRLRLDKSFIPEKVLYTRESKMNKLFNIDISFSVWNKLYKLSFLRDHKLNFLVGFHFEDLDFTFKAFFYSNIVIKNKGVFYGYRQRADSIMRDVSPKLLDKLYIIDQHRYFLEKNNCFDLMRKDYYCLYIKIHTSIIYATLINGGDFEIKSEIIKKLFNNKIDDIINEINLENFNLKFKIYIILFKLGLINKNLVKFLCKFY